MPLAIAVEKSLNRKLGQPVSTTHTSQVTCPRSCPFLKAGCYAELGLQGIHTARLNRSKGSRRDAAREEAAAIRILSGKNPMRLHVVGDCATQESARIVSRAADRYRAKNGQPTWSYTHGWREVDRASWGNVSVLASCEGPGDVRKAMRKGYAAALVGPHKNGKKAWVEGGVRMVPCPNQTVGVQCVDCRLCFDDAALRARRAAIVFSPHGSGAAKVRQAISACGKGHNG